MILLSVLKLKLSLSPHKKKKKYHILNKFLLETLSPFHCLYLHCSNSTQLWKKIMLVKSAGILMVNKFTVYGSYGPDALGLQM